MDIIKLRIEGMQCSACAEGIVASLGREAGILDVNVNAITGKGRVKFDETLLSAQQIIRLVSSYGFPAQEDSVQADDARELRSLARRFFTALPLFIAIFTLHMFAPQSALNHYAQFALATIVQFGVGAGFYAGAMSVFKTKNADMNLLIVLGTSSGYFYSCFALFFANPAHEMGLYFEGSVAVITFVLLGEWLKTKAKKRSSEGVRLLAQLLPNQARVIRAGIEQEIELLNIKAGDICIIKAGEKIPIDGVILEGEAEVDSSHISGEYLPVHKRAGERLIGGSVLTSGYVRAQATKAAKESLLFEMVDLLESAQNQKPPIGKLADKIASIFVPSVIFISILTGILWLLFGDGVEQAFLASVAVLIISCPCALGLATPISIVTAISRASKEGILIKNPDIIEKSQRINIALFDKTGTLTKGELTLKEARFFAPIPAGFYEMLLSTESGSAHPISYTLTKYAKENITNLEQSPKLLQTPQVLVGMGIIGDFESGKFIVGNQTLLKQHGIALEKGERFPNLSNIYVAHNGNLIAQFGLIDSLREGAQELVDYCKTRGIEPMILSGDSHEAVSEVAKRLGIASFKAEILPKDKHLVVEELMREKSVLFVGDGVNDALALQSADIGIALGSGSALAQASGDILLMREDLSGVKQTIEICDFTLKNIKQNLFFAYLYNSILIPIAAGALYPWLGILLQPSLAGAAMALSSVSVVSNALRIGRMKL
ncbi:MAG: heavy metal translocating P-type ATPase [Wolinella sp.]